ncbi:MAG: hypothetical protein M1824_001760 [Vezdaea acicularis]|nr:MAG: hypothetical protein M1824_001760 [Vezdaea acicularis]
MPPHMHPRSRLTTSLFTTTLLASFLVVGMPHILPCPAGPQYADSGNGQLTAEGTKRRRRRKPGLPSDDEEKQNMKLESFAVDENDVGGEGRTRECPVPKPTGLVGTILGFQRPMNTSDVDDA